MPAVPSTSARPQRSPDVRRAALAAVAALIVLAAVAAVALWASGRGESEGGGAGLGSAPGVGGAGSAPTGPFDSASPLAGAPVLSSGSPGAAPGAPGSVGLGGPTVPAAPGGLVATYVIDEGLLADRMDITITNVGQADAQWSRVVIRFSGINLIITPGPGVAYEVVGRDHVFTAQATLRTVAGGASVSFYFLTTGGGVLGSPVSCTLDGQECKV
jgi:hypothetical protein